MVYHIIENNASGNLDIYSENPNESDQLRGFSIFMGVWFMIQGFYLIVLGTVIYKISTILTFFVVSIYFLTYLVAINANSLLLAIIVSLIFFGTLAFIVWCFYVHVGFTFNILNWSIGFAIIGLIIIDSVFIFGDIKTDGLALIILLTVSGFFLIGFLLSISVFETATQKDDAAIRLKWIRRHIL